MGISVAFRLAQAGTEVTVLEAGRLGGGTSSVSFAWLNANNKPPFAYHQLNVSGMGEYFRLRDELGAVPWLHIDGNVEWDGSDGGAERLRDKVNRLRDWGYQVELLPISELRYLEPDLVAPPELEEFAFYPTEGYLDTVACIASLAGTARGYGATIREHCRVTGIIQHGDRVVGVETSTGENLFADTVVSCVGHCTGDITRMVGVPLPMAPTVGLVAISAPTAVRLRSVHHDDKMNIRPDGAGRIMMRHYDFDEMVSEDTPVDPIPSFLDSLLERVVKVVPGLAGTHIESVRIGVRPIPADGLSAIGPLVPGLYVIASHSAVTLGALFGRLAAQEILTGEVDPRLADFRPTRLVQ